MPGRVSGEFGSQSAGAGSPYGSPPSSSPAHPRREMTSYSPGTSMRMLRGDLRTVTLADGAAHTCVSLPYVTPALFAAVLTCEGNMTIARSTELGWSGLDWTWLTKL